MLLATTDGKRSCNLNPIEFLIALLYKFKSSYSSKEAFDRHFSSLKYRLTASSIYLIDFCRLLLFAFRTLEAFVSNLLIEFVSGADLVSFIRVVLIVALI